MSRFRRVVQLGVIAVFSNIIACTSDGPTTVRESVNAVVLNLGLSHLLVGQQLQAGAIAQNAAGKAIAGIPISWSSSTPAVATVSSSGVVVAIAPGTSEIRATGAGLSASVVVTVESPPTQLAIISTPPLTAPNGIAFVQPVVIQLLDVSGAVVRPPGVTVTASISSGGGTLSGTTTATTDTTGTAQFTSLVMTGTVGDRALTFSSNGLKAVTSAAIALTPGPATKLGMRTQASTPAANGVAFAQQPAVQLMDASNNAVVLEGVVVSSAVGSGAPLLGGGVTATTDANGVATFADLAFTGAAGIRTLTFSASGMSQTTSGTIAVLAGDANQLALSTQPSATAISAQAFLRQPVVQVRDASNNPVGLPGVAVVASIASGTGTLGGTTTVTTGANGAAAFSDLRVSGSGTFTLQFAAPSASPGLSSAISAPIAIAAGAPAQLSITRQPSAGAALAAPPAPQQTTMNGVAFAPQPIIQLLDASARPVPLAGIQITAEIASGGGTLGGTLTAMTDDNGMATFANLSVTGTIGDRTLTFTATGLTPATSDPITLLPGAPNKLEITTQPSASAQNGVLLAVRPVVRLEDISGNAVEQPGVIVIVALQSGGGLLGGTTAATTNANGVVTFDLSITGPIGPRTLLFSATAVTGATSGPVTITAGPATQLSIALQPSASVVTGLPFSQQPAVQLRDVSNNLVSDPGIIVTAIATGGPILGGIATATTNASGTATFTNLSLSGTGSNPIQFAATGLTTATSSPVAIGTVAATQLTMVTQPSATASNGATLGAQPAVQLRDAGNAVVALPGVVVTASIASGGGTLSGTTTATSDANGVATFANLALGGVLGDRTLRFSASGLSGATSNVVTLTAANPAALALTTQPSATAQSGVAFLSQPVIQLRDSSGNIVNQAGVAVGAAILSGGGLLGGTTTVLTDANGLATFADILIIGAVGNRTLTFSAGPLAGVNSIPVSVTAGPASRLEITTQPSASAASGVVFSQGPVVQVQDAAGNPVGVFGVSISASIAAGAGSLGGPVSATTGINGAASFPNLSITGSGSFTLQFTSSGLASAVSAPISVGVVAATQLSIATQPPATATIGTTLTQQPVIQLRDASSAPAPLSGVTVTAAIATGSGTLSGTPTAVTNSSGVASFAGLAINGPNGAKTLIFTAPGLTSATSSTIATAVGAPSKLGALTQPSASAPNAATFPAQPTVQLQDGSGNPVLQSGIVVLGSIASGGGIIGGTTSTPTNVNGIASFTDLSITGTTGVRTLSFNATGMSGATSNSISLTPGSPSQLSISTQPSSVAVSGAAFAQQPAVQVRDASTNPVLQSGIVVTAAIQTGGGTLGGTVTATTNALGVASFTNLSVSGTVGARTLLFSAPAISGAISSSVSLTANSASKIGISTQPSATAVGGTALSQQPVVQLQDLSSNPVGQSGTNVVATISSGSGTLSGTTTATTNSAGTATFSDLTVTGSGPHTLQFAAAPLSPSTSSVIAVGTVAATKLTMTTQPSATVAASAAFPTQPVVQLNDALDAPVPASGVTVTASIASGGGTLLGTITATTNGSGAATFTNLAISGPAGPRTLAFSASGMSDANSSTVTTTVGSPSKLAITSPVPASAVNGVPLGQQPAISVQDASGNTVSQSGVAITASIATGGGTLGGTLTAATDVNGVATFLDLTMTGTTGPRTLNFTATGLTGVTSPSISLGAGPASKVAVTTQPSATAQNGATLSQQPTLQLRDGSNNPVNLSAVNVTVTIQSGGGSLAGTTVVPTNSAGVATFTDLSLGGTSGTRTLGFTSGSLTGATSSNVALGAGAATQLTVTTQPSASAVSGATLAQQPAAQLRDGAGNVVSQGGIVVIASILTGGGTLGGTTTATTNSNGLATFTGLSISGAGGNRTLSFTSSGLASATSGTIAISPAATKLSITTQPSTNAGSGVTFAQQPVLQLRDAANAVVAQGGVVVTAVIATGGGTLGGALTATTNASGVATFTNLSITGALGARTLTFSAPSLTSVTSGSVTIGAAATQLTITTQPGLTAVSGAPLSPQPVLQLRDAASAPVTTAGVVVTATIASGTGTIGGTATATSNASGVVSFTTLSILGSGNFTVSFGASGMTGATSITIAVAGATLEPEPVFDPATQIKLFEDDFDSYTTFASVTAAGWKGLNGGITQDVSTGPAGANQIAPSGYDGTGKALRLVYDGVSNGSGQEAHSWSRPIGDVLAGAPGHAFYMSYYIRITPGGGIELDQDANHNIQVKWLELWNNTNGDRAQFNTGYSTCTNGLPTTLFQFYGNSGGNTICNAGQVRPPFFSQGTRAWHRITHKYMTQSATGARDGIAQVWMDGVLILSIAQAYCGVAVPNYVGSKPGGPPLWCNTGDQDAMYVKNYALRFTLGSVHTGGLWPFTLDWDHMILWRD